MPSLENKFERLTRAASALLLLLTLLFASTGIAQEAPLIVLTTGPETTELLQMIGEPLAQAADLPPKEIKYHVILNPALNAFALLNQHIVFNSGLLLVVKDRDELAGVMAHEISHLKAGHHMQLQNLSKKLSIQSLITTAAGILAGVVTSNSQIGQAVVTGGLASSQASVLEAIRRKEAQADNVAIELLIKAGFNPNGLADFMHRLVRQQQISTLPPPYLLTHPISTERLMDTRRMAQESTPTTPRRPNKEENQLLARAQAVLEAETNPAPEEGIIQFRNRLKLDPDNLALNQGLAESFRSAGRLAEAETLFTSLLKKSKTSDPYLLRNRGFVRIEMGKYVEAEQDLQAALKLLPKNEDLLFRLAFTLKELKKPLDASRLLRQLTATHPNEPRYFYLLGLTDGQAGHEGEGHIAMGRFYTLTQEFKTAIFHFQEAIRLLPANSTEQAIAKNELLQTRKLEREFKDDGREKSR